MKNILKIKKRYKISLLKSISIYIKYKGNMRRIKKAYDFRIVV